MQTPSSDFPPPPETKKPTTKKRALKGCAFGCGGLTLALILLGYLGFRWLTGTAPIPKPNTCILPDAEMCVLFRVDPGNKAIVRMLTDTVQMLQSPPADATPAARETAEALARFRPDAITWLMPCQIVFSARSAEKGGPPDFLIFGNLGRFRGFLSLMRYALVHQEKKAGAKKETAPETKSKVAAKTEKTGIEEVLAEYEKPSPKSAETAIENSTELVEVYADSPILRSEENMYMTIGPAGIVIGPKTDLVKKGIEFLRRPLRRMASDRAEKMLADLGQDYDLLIVIDNGKRILEALPLIERNDAQSASTGTGEATQDNEIAIAIDRLEIGMKAVAGNKIFVKSALWMQSEGQAVEIAAQLRHLPFLGKSDENEKAEVDDDVQKDAALAALRFEDLTVKREKKCVRFETTIVGILDMIRATQRQTSSPRAQEATQEKIMHLATN